jgi:5'-methylthioadenosine phosphorylase
MKIGIIGGSGLDDPNILEAADEKIIQTPFGRPSSPIKEGKIRNVRVAILARHGKNHSISPSNVNYRANIWAMKEIGCTHILASTAVGSLKDEIEPGHLVFPNQFIDFTRQRNSSFFDEKQVIHTPMADPFCPQLLELLQNTAEELKIPYHTNKTVITIEGPRFSTRAESFMFKSWKADIINMSSCPEVALAREQNIHYASLAMATDYDCWKEHEEPVTWEMIQKTMDNNSINVIKILLNTIPRIKNWDDLCAN